MSTKPTKGPSKAQMYKEYLPVYHNINKNKYPVNGPGYGWMKSATWVISMVALLALYLLAKIACVV